MTQVVVLPNHPTVAQVVAFRRALEDFPAAELRFCKVPEPNKVMLAQWRKNGTKPYLIDLGKNNHRRTNWTSAAGVVADLSPFEQDEGWDWLINLMERHNRTGFLKGYPFSVASILREIYYVEEAGEVLRQTVRVIDAYLAGKEREWNPGDFQNDALKELWHRVGLKQDRPFTLSWYLKHLWCAGTEEVVISNRVNWWIMKKAEVDRLVKEAEESVRKMQTSMMKNFVCVFMNVDGYFEHMAAIKRAKLRSPDILVVSDKDNRTTIYSYPLVRDRSRRPPINLEPLSKVLDERELGKWKLLQWKHKQVLMNGSVQFSGVQPTDLTQRDLEYHIRTKLHAPPEF